MSTKVYLDLVRTPPQGGKGRASRCLYNFLECPVPPSKIFFFSFFCITTSENTFITETEASGNNTYLYYGSCIPCVFRSKFFFF